MIGTNTEIIDSSCQKVSIYLELSTFPLFWSFSKHFSHSFKSRFICFAFDAALQIVAICHFIRKIIIGKPLHDKIPIVINNAKFVGNELAISIFENGVMDFIIYLFL